MMSIRSKVCTTGIVRYMSVIFSTDILDVDLDKDLPFSQPVTFAHLEWQRCLAAAHDQVH